jgi:hypothetical protein
MCSNINYIEICTSDYRVTYYFNFLLLQLVSARGKLTFYSKVLKSVPYVTLESKAADEIRIKIFSVFYRKGNK